MAKRINFALVKWVSGGDAWDVLNMDSCFKYEKSLKKDVLKNPENYIGKNLDFHWKEGEETDPGLLLAIGNEKDMEIKRTNLMETHFANLGVPVPEQDQIKEGNSVSGPNEAKKLKLNQQMHLMDLVDNNSTDLIEDGLPGTSSEGSKKCKCEKYDKLKSKYNKLKMELEKKEQKIKKYKDQKSIYEKLQEIIPSVSRQSAPSSNTLDEEAKPQKVEIGADVFVDKSDLMVLLRSSISCTTFARSLLTHLFEKDEIIGSSLTGKKCNAKKDALTKPALDSKRVNAIIAYTLKKYPGSGKRRIMESLANKIKEIQTRDKTTV